ncbi:DUF6320 domain-containing protein [Dehalobacter sp. DCM]|uniref:DUF6320 domain-containing protein n=1 Tax=Dehalobacter sp. DCM TaxID=2907827 RepID=UPI003081673D|nr:DUF6320 domain-containing protein [Dehalobacter sp. DCM]
MPYCNHCKVSIRGNRERCPLCRNIIAIESDTSDCREIFPAIPPVFERNLALRIMIFSTVVAIVVSLVIYVLFPSDVKWPVFVLLGLISMWLNLFVVLRKRYHISKNILWQVAILSILSILWDWGTGWHGWSLDYVIPFIFVAAMLIMYVTAKIMKISARDYITYLLLDGLLGIVPILFIRYNLVEAIYPSVLSVAISVISLSAIFIFQGDYIKSELIKRMHI